MVLVEVDAGVAIDLEVEEGGHGGGYTGEWGDRESRDGAKGNAKEGEKRVEGMGGL